MFQKTYFYLYIINLQKRSLDTVSYYLIIFYFICTTTTLLLQVYDNILVVSNYDKSSAKFLSGALGFVGKVGFKCVFFFNFLLQQLLKFFLNNDLMEH